MVLQAPQIILTGLMLFSAGMCAARFGQPKRDSYDVVDWFIGPAITFGLLWWGGFYG